MSFTIAKLKSLTPAEAMKEIGKNISVAQNASKTVLYSTKTAHSFEVFQTTLLIVSLDAFDQVGDYEADALDRIESFYVYGGYITANGRVGGCTIEKHKDGEFVCIVTNESCCTMNLVEAEKYLYENWYKSECTGE